MKKEFTARQLEIIEKSGEILMNKGIVSLTTKNLAREMNFSESALYRHFKDKEEIITHLIQYLSQNISDRFEKILQENLKPEETYLQLFKSQFSFFKKHPHFIIIVLSDGLLDNSEGIKKAIMELVQTNFFVFKVVFEKGQKSKIFQENIDSKYLVHYTMGAFRLQMLQWKLENFGFDIEIEGMKTMTQLLSLMKEK